MTKALPLKFLPPKSRLPQVSTASPSTLGTPARVPQVSTALSSTLGFLLFFCSLTPAHPQGCAQCRETLGQTPARTQQAYRRAITLMTVAGTTIFAASILTLRRFR